MNLLFTIFTSRSFGMDLFWKYHGKFYKQFRKISEIWKMSKRLLRVGYSNGVAVLGRKRRARAQLAGKYKFDIPASFNINIINLDGRKYMIFSYNPAAGYDESALGSTLTQLWLVDSSVGGKSAVLHKKCVKNYRSFFYHFCTPYCRREKFDAWILQQILPLRS